MHQDFEKRMIQYSADVKDAIARLANVAAPPWVSPRGERAS